MDHIKILMEYWNKPLSHTLRKIAEIIEEDQEYYNQHNNPIKAVVNKEIGNKIFRDGRYINISRYRCIKCENTNENLMGYNEKGLICYKINKGRVCFGKIEKIGD